MIGWKRWNVLEGEIGALRQRVGEIEAMHEIDQERMASLQSGLNEVSGLLDSLLAHNAALAARLDALEGRADRLGESVEPMTEAIGIERSRSLALEQTLSKLALRIDTQGEEAQILSTALLQRLEAKYRAAGAA